MELSTSQIQSILNNDIGARLLRSKSADVVIPFLFENYKIQVRQQINNNELENSLVIYLQKHINAERELADDLEQQNILERDTDNKKRAKKYIDLWCSESRQYLKRVITSHGVELYLDPSIDRLFSWIEKCQENQTIGAESRFSTILSQLRELNLKTNLDVSSRIKELEAKKKEINEEIKLIKQTGNVVSYDRYQIQEWLSVITKSSKELLGDFNQIRANFQSVINDIYKKQSEQQASRGDILGYTLDTNEELRHSPQGRSFTSFWNFISGDSENEINNLVDSIMIKAKNQGLEWNDNFLNNLSRYFFDSGNQIVAQNRLLTSRINKMLSFRESNDQSRIHDLTIEIKNGMSEYKKQLEEGKEKETFDMFIETKPDLRFPQARFPVLPSFDFQFGPIESFKEEKNSIQNFKELFNQSHIELNRMEENAMAMFKRGKTQFSLKDLTEFYPIEQGLSEVVAWFTMMDNLNKKIDDSVIEQIIYERNGKKYIAEVPRIVFYE